MCAVAWDGYRGDCFPAVGGAGGSTVIGWGGAQSAEKNEYGILQDVRSKYHRSIDVHAQKYFIAFH